MSAAERRPRSYRARWVVPVCSPPMRNAVVEVRDGRITGIGPDGPASQRQRMTDLGDAILMPGIVNTHAHLQMTSMRGLVENREFPEWIQRVMALSAAMTPADWEASARAGCREALAGGVTTIGDCGNNGSGLRAMAETGHRGVYFQEVFGARDTRPDRVILAELDLALANRCAEAAGSRLIVGLSPHSPYSVRPSLMVELAARASMSELRMCIHAAESQAESDLFAAQAGAIVHSLAERGVAICPAGPTPIQHLEALSALGARTLIAHAVNLSAHDMSLLTERGVAVAHCPASNAKLGCGIPAVGALLAAGVPVGLGSDSVVSNNKMDLFEEMRLAVLLQRASRRTVRAMSAAQALFAATLGGAACLGLEGETGSIAVGKRADLAVISPRLGETGAGDPVAQIVYATSAADVAYTLIDGDIVYRRADAEELAE